MTTHKLGKVMSIDNMVNLNEVPDLTVENFSEEILFGKFLELHFDLLCICSIDGKFIKLNKSWEDVLGYSKKELESKNFLEFVHPSDFIDTSQIMTTLCKQKQILIFTNRLKCKNGTYKNIEWCSKSYENCIYFAARDITNTIQFENSLKISEKNFKTFFEALDDIIVVGNIQGEIIFANAVTSSKLGYTQNELQKMRVTDLNMQENRIESEEIFSNMIAGKRSYSPLSLKKKDGTFLPVETTMWFGLWDGVGSFFSISKDLSINQAAYDRFYKLFNNNPVLMAINNIIDDKFIQVNALFIEKLGYSEEEIIGKTSQELNLFVDIKEQEHVVEILRTTGSIKNVELKIRKKDGQIMDGLFSGDIIDNQIEKVLLIVMMDITDRKQKENEVQYLSFHDQLTGLYNRRFYEEELMRLDVERNLPLTLVMCDVNGLKIVNDSFGHTMGDDLLKKAATTIHIGCREEDIISRIGGDEFVIILPNADSLEAEKIVLRIKNLLLNEKIGALDVSISFGIATKTNSDQTLLDIFKLSEDNMYQNKLLDKSNVRSNIIDVIMNTLYEMNPREMPHARRAQDICEIIAHTMNFNENDTNQIKLAGLMHDIGKMGVDENILNKIGDLTKDEWSQIKKHSEIGYRILSSSNEFSDIAVFVYEHHERWDGTGYPKGLKGKEISLPARIIAIVESYVAMTTDNKIGKLFSKEAALVEIQKCAGTQFDPEIANVFLSASIGI